MKIAHNTTLSEVKLMNLLLFVFCRYNKARGVIYYILCHITNSLGTHNINKGNNFSFMQDAQYCMPM